MARKHVQIQDSEVEFPADVQLVSTTDLRGVITYANPAFCRIAGYQVDELVGHNHNLVRHPDMPKAAFADLWDRLKEELEHVELEWMSLSEELETMEQAFFA